MKTIISFVFIFYISVGFSQRPQPRIDRIDERKGLFLSNEVSDVKVDSEGYTWIISFSEIVRYDGESFKEIITTNVDHASFIKFYESPNHEKYVNDLNGGIYFIKNDSLVEFLGNEIIKENNTHNTVVEVLIDSTDTIHAEIGNFGILSFKDGKLVKKLTHSKKYNYGKALIIRRALKPAVIRGFFNKNKEWNSTFRKPRGMNTYLVNEKLDILDSIQLKGYSKGIFRSIVELENGNWLVSSSHGDLVEVSKRKVEQNISFEHAILNLFIDSKNNLWISTYGEGVYFYKNSIIKEGNEEIFFSNTKTIVSAEDREGGIWAYSEKEGVFRIENPTCRYINDETHVLLNSKVETIELVSDSLYIGGDNNNVSIYNLVSNSVSQLSVPDGEWQFKSMGSFPIKDLEFDIGSGKLWLTQRTCVRFYANSKWSTVDDKNLIKGEYLDKFLSNSSKIDSLSAIGTHQRQFFFCRDSTFSFISKPFPDLLYDIIVADELIYVNARDGLYSYLNGNAIALGDQFPILKQRLSDWLLWEGELLLSTNKEGLFVLKNDSLEAITYKGQRLMNTKISLRTKDEVWLFSNLGTFILSRSENNKLALSVYGAIPKVYITDIENNEETLYFGTKKKGILTTTYEDLKKQRLRPPILNVKKVMLGDNLIDALESTFNSTYNDNTLQVWYTGISYEDWTVNYRYRLLGLHNDWHFGLENYIQYSNLDHGEYEFELQARKGEQIWSPLKKFSFEISPPFWKTWWFIWASIILILYVTYHTLSYRIQVANKEKSLIISRLIAEQKALRAKMDPHFMFNILASLQYLVINNKNDKAARFLEQFSALMRSTLDQTDQEFVPILNEVSFLREYTEMEKLRLEEKFNYKFKVDLGINIEDLIPNFLIQPFIENAIHHGLKNSARMGFLKVEFTKEGDYLKVTIEDNGIGYNKASQVKLKKKITRKSHGISTVRERLILRNENKVQKSILIEDLNDKDENQKGTRVTLYIKIEK